jgi:uncharacterized protein with HEPN domain
MQPESLKFLFDIQRACRLLSSFVAGKTFEDYVGDALLRSGIERQLIIVGEALNRLMKIDPATAAAVTDARQIIAFRNILVHGYDIVHDATVWEVLEKDLSQLTKDVDSLLAQGRAEHGTAEDLDAESSG